MLICYTECPHCYKDTEVDYEGQEQGEELYYDCEKCKKKFKVYYELSIDFFPSQIEVENARSK